MILACTAHSMATSAAHFTIKARDGKARCGILSTKNGSIDTPAILVYTRRGGPLNLTSPDMLAAVTPPVQGVQIDTMQFMENPDARIIREYGQGAHGFLCLEGVPILAGNRDPTMYEYGTRPSTDKEVHVSIHSGGHMVSPERYMETVVALRPDMFVALCDEIPADAKPKRIAMSTRRTTAWLDVCLALHAADSQAAPRLPTQPLHTQSHFQEQQQQQQQQEGDEGRAQVVAENNSSSGVGGRAQENESSCPLSGSLLLAPLVGGALEVERARAATAVAEKQGVGGYALCGLGTGEPPALRPTLIAASLDALPPADLATRPVFASGLCSSPEELLQAVGAGVDLLDCGLVAQVTAGGYALTFPLRPPPSWQPPTEAHAATAVDPATESTQMVEAGGQDCPAAAVSATNASSAVPSVHPTPLSSTPALGTGPDVALGADDTKINLWSTAYRLEKGPLLPGCGCFTCRWHSRAYMHHLLNTHEMLVDVLLEAHNTSHLQGFCQAIREAISAGRYKEYQQWFRSLRTVPLVAPPRHVTAKRKALGTEDGQQDDRVAVKQGSSVEGVAREQGREATPHSKWVRV